MSQFRPHYLPRTSGTRGTRGTRRRQRALRRLARAALFPFHLLAALLRWLASPRFFD